MNLLNKRELRELKIFAICRYSQRKRQEKILAEILKKDFGYDNESIKTEIARILDELDND